jgi:hypothetical protein
MISRRQGGGNEAIIHTSPYVTLRDLQVIQVIMLYVEEADNDANKNSALIESAFH